MSFQTWLGLLDFFLLEEMKMARAEFQSRAAVSDADLFLWFRQGYSPREMLSYAAAVCRGDVA